MPHSSNVLQVPKVLFYSVSETLESIQLIMFWIKLNTAKRFYTISTLFILLLRRDFIVQNFYFFNRLLFGLAKARLELSQRRSLSLLSTTHPPPPTTPGTFKALPGKVQSQISVCNLNLTQLDEICRKIPPLPQTKSHHHQIWSKLNQAEHQLSCAEF